MGAPKQKWTSEEEAALRAGVVKHGPGKWRTILKDPEFSGVLVLRSNVDLKDKWRNMAVTAHGCGSRERARLALKKSKLIPKPEDNSLALSTIVRNNEEIVDAKPLAVSNEISEVAGSKNPISRLDTTILEAITNLKEPSGSNRTAIAVYIEDRYNAPPNFKRVLSAKLKFLTASGKLNKVNRKYRIAPTSFFSEEKKSSGMLLVEGRQRDPPIIEKDDIKILTKSQIDAELSKMRNMTAQEAASAAAQAVAEAEAALAEAEQAAKEAEEAEADAEAAQAFAEAAMMTLKTRNKSKLMVHA